MFFRKKKNTEERKNYSISTQKKRPDTTDNFFKKL